MYSYPLFEGEVDGGVTVALKRKCERCSFFNFMTWFCLFDVMRSVMRMVLHTVCILPTPLMRIGG